MERPGQVEEGQEIRISERSPSAGRYTYLVEPSVAMSGIYRTTERIKARTGIIRKIEETDGVLFSCRIGKLENSEKTNGSVRKLTRMGEK